MVVRASLIFTYGFGIDNVLALGPFLRPAMLNKLKIFLMESRQELRHVNWPTRQEAIRLTGIVIFISLGISVFLGLFDYLFTYIIQTLIAR